MSGSDQDERIAISGDIYSRIEDRVAVTRFGTVEEYVEFVLDNVLFQVESESGDADVQKQQVEDRLEALGYLNE